MWKECWQGSTGGFVFILLGLLQSILPNQYNRSIDNIFSHLIEIRRLAATHSKSTHFNLTELTWTKIISQRLVCFFFLAIFLSLYALRSFYHSIHRQALFVVRLEPFFIDDSLLVHGASKIGRHNIYTHTDEHCGAVDRSSSLFNSLLLVLNCNFLHDEEEFSSGIENSTCWFSAVAPPDNPWSVRRGQRSIPQMGHCYVMQQVLPGLDWVNGPSE